MSLAVPSKNSDKGRYLCLGCLLWDERSRACDCAQRKMSSWLCVLALFSASCLAAQTQVYVQPEQIKLSYGGSDKWFIHLFGNWNGLFAGRPGSLIVTWITFNNTGESIVEYGLETLELSKSGNRTLFTDGGGQKRQFYIHRVYLNNLSPGARYSESCFAQIWSGFTRNCFQSITWAVGLGGVRYILPRSWKMEQIGVPDLPYSETWAIKTHSPWPGCKGKRNWDTLIWFCISVRAARVGFSIHTFPFVGDMAYDLNTVT